MDTEHRVLISEEGDAPRCLRPWERLMVAAGVVMGCGMCLWPAVWFFAHLLPPRESMEAARRHAQADGLPMPEWGGLQQYVIEPDVWGGCEVEVLFRLPDECGKRREFAARVRRSSLPTGWRVVEAGPRDRPR